MGPELSDPQLHRNYHDEEMCAIRVLVNKVNTMNWGVSAESLETDASAQVCVVLSSIAAMMKEMRVLSHAVIQELPSSVQRKVRDDVDVSDSPCPYLSKDRAYACSPNVGCDGSSCSDDSDDSCSE